MTVGYGSKVDLNVLVKGTACACWMAMGDVERVEWFYFKWITRVSSCVST